MSILFNKALRRILLRWLLPLIAFLRAISALGVTGAFLYLLSGVRPGRFRIPLRRFGRSIVIRGVSSDRWVLNSVLICEEYRGMADVDARTIVDAGANIGCATIWFGRQFPAARIVALEPDPENHSLAVQNTSGLPNVRVLQAGLWGRKTRLKVVNPDAWKYALQVEECPDGPIGAESVLSILEQTGWEHIDILKMDIEGAEAAVFATDVDRWIGKVNVLIVELHQDVAPQCARLLCSALASADFRLSWRGEDLVATRMPLLQHSRDIVWSAVAAD